MRLITTRAALCAVLLAALAGANNPQGIVRADSAGMQVLTPPIDESLPPLSAIAPDDVIFSAMGHDWTREEFEAATRFYPPPSLRIINELEIPFERFLPSQIHSAIGEIVTNMALAEEARERGIELRDTDELDSNLNDIATRLWLRHHGVIAASHVTDEQIRELRDENEEAFVQEEILRLRHMFFPTYEEHIVQEGDTLESISEAINGDRSLASHIITADTRETRAGEDSHETGQTEPDVPLQAGEILLVPMGDQAAAEIEALALAAHQRLVEGEDFVEVARDATGNPSAASLITVRPAEDEKPMIPQLREAFESVGDREFSEPVRTRHGYQIVFRESYQENRLMEVSEMRRRFLMDIRERMVYRAYMNVLRELWEEYDEIYIDEEALLAAGTDPDAESKIIMNLPDQSYTVLDFVNQFGDKLEEATTFEERRALLIDHRPLHSLIMEWDIRRLDIPNSRELELARKVVESTLLTPLVIEELTEERLEEPTEEELRERFVRDADRFTRVPSAFVWRISVTADTDSEPGTEEYRNAVRRRMRELSEVLAGIENVEQFEQLAREMSEDEFAMMGGRVGRVNSFQEDGYYAPVIERMQGRGPVGPIIQGRDLQGYWVEEVFDTSETAFRDVRDILRRNEMSTRRIQIGRQIEREFMEGAGLKIYFNPNAEEDSEEEQ